MFLVFWLLHVIACVSIVCFPFYRIVEETFVTWFEFDFISSGKFLEISTRYRSLVRLHRNLVPNLLSKKFQFAEFLVQIIFSARKMSFNRLRLEYALEGTSNFCSWKDRMEVVLDDNGIWEYTKIDIPKLAALDAQSLAQWKKDVARAKRIILEGFSDPGGCRSPPTYSTWTPTTVSFNFLVSLIIAHFTIFCSFLGPEHPKPFWGGKQRFLG